MNQSNRSQLFDEWAKNYDNDVLSGGDGFPFWGYKQVLERVFTLADVKPNMRILDLGIGTGNLASYFINRNCEVWGLDSSTEMLAQAKLKFPRVSLVQADLLGDWSAQLQPPFDRVVSAYVFHHFELETKISLLRKILTEYIPTNGNILVADIAFPTSDVRAGAFQRWQWDEDEYYWAADETIAACQQAGLRVAFEQISICAGIFTFHAEAITNSSGTIHKNGA